MSSNLQIRKLCKWCGREFTAKTTKTDFCGSNCASLAYKARKRKAAIEDSNIEYDYAKSGAAALDSIEFLSQTQAASLLGLSRKTIYIYIKKGIIKVWRLDQKTLIRRTDIEALFVVSTPKPRREKAVVEINEFYTTQEILDRYGISHSGLYKIAKEKNIPKVMKMSKTYWSKKHIDACFAKKTANPEITSWYTAEEIKAKFGMSDSAVWNFVSKNAIPKKKEGSRTFYSKRHIDIAKGLPVEEEREYYTYKEAMDKYNLTHDQVCHYLKAYKIYKIKVGKITKFDREQFDELFTPPKI